MILNKTELRYYLKEKYKYSELKIQEILEKEPPVIKGPLAYALGYVDFLNTRIDLSHKTLIPRPETEYWVNNIIESLKNEPRERVILDIFCGSGCIGISILKHLNNTHVTFADIDKDAIEQTKLNTKINKIPKERFNIIETNLFENIPNQKFDIIFANPPYVGENDEYGEEIKAEPKIAIFAKDNGLAIIKKFLANAFKYLNKNGVIYMEIGENQEEDIKKIIKMPNARIAFNKDQYGKTRMVEIRN